MFTSITMSSEIVTTIDNSSTERSSLWSRVRRSATARTVLGIAFVLVPSVVAFVALEQVYLTFMGPESRYARLANIIAPVILAGVVFGTYILYSRLFDRAWPTDLRRRNSGRDLLAGTLLGSGLFTVSLAIVWVAGGYSVVGVNPLTTVLPAVTGVMFFVGLEEVINRGIVLPEIESRFGSWIALLVSSLFFAGYHIVLTTNPTPTAVAVIFVASVLLGAGYLYTRQLWLPIAIHAGWNFTQGAIFGVQVSSNDVESVAFLVGETTGPVWLSGGSFGLEGSLVTLVVLALGTALVVWRVWQRGVAVPRP
jgi:hypothetical protein